MKNSLRAIALCAALAFALPAAAQIPCAKTPSGICVLAQPVVNVNPDGTLQGTGGQLNEVQLWDGTNSAAILKSNGAGVSVNNYGQLVQANQWGFNGTTWDRVFSSWAYNHIIAAATTAVKASAGTLHTVNVNTAGAGSATVYDSLSGSGTIIAIIDTGVKGPTPLDVPAAIGITVVTSAAADLTVTYR